jgi:hypothetical protein
MKTKTKTIPVRINDWFDQINEIGQNKWHICYMFCIDNFGLNGTQMHNKWFYRFNDGNLTFFFRNEEDAFWFSLSTSI